jgi:hypothetical protein
MKTEVQRNIIETFKKYNETLYEFSESELNTVPYQGSWTAGQNTQHIILASSGYPKLFAGKTEKTARKPDEKIKEVEALFLNFNIKMNSPEYIKPEIKEYNKNSLTLSLLNIESDLLTASETCDLTLICLDSEVPGFGTFTILEWISFALIHTQRHTKQLHDIFNYVTKL